MLGRARRSWVTVSLLCACGQDGVGDGGNAAGEPDELLGITAAHNRTRAEVGVAALAWNDDHGRATLP